MGGTRARTVVALLIVVCASGGATSRGTHGDAAGADAYGPSAARWLQIIQQYARSAVDHQLGIGGVPRPFTVQLPVGAAGASEHVTLPLLVLPVPVPAPNTRGAAGASEHVTLPLLVLPVHVPAPNTRGCSASDESKYHLDQFHPDPPYMPHIEPQYHLPTPQPERPTSPQPHYTPEPQLQYAPEPQYVPQPVASKQPEPERVVLRGDDKCGGGYSGKGPVPTPRLIQLFKEQTAADPHLPPALLDAPPPPLPESHAAPLPPSPEYLPPPPLLWDTGMFLRARLTVPRAGYTEPYTVWWDAASGASRVDLHYGNTTCLRQPASAGPARLLERRIDRTNEPVLRVCGVAKATASPARAPPGLPDPELFSFAGHVVHEGASVERWSHTVSPALGEGGAAPEESLVFRHELLVRREHEAALPVRYTVDVDSSVLGPRSGGYVHHYEEAKTIHPDPALFAANPDTDCDSTEQLDANDAEHFARLAPLHEYTLPTRDARHNPAFCHFKAEYKRVYADEHEDAMRKNLFVHCRRFVGSANREGAPFEAEVNFLGDRLDEELEVLHGVRFDSAADTKGDRFPHNEAEASNLPDTFDWRDLGGVTPVLYQGSCSSCWAFAVAGSVEGGLYAATRRLIPLAEQKLVDCGHEHGAHGCNGTWPVHAYNHVKSRGLPARGEYPEYAERVMACRSPPVGVVTRISAHVDTPPRSERALKLAIRQHAPNVVVIDSRPKSYLFYKRGVLRDERCLKGPKNKLNHAVLAVGWGVQRGETHFIMKNTYSARWGDGGYISMHAPTNTCGHQTVPSYAVVRRKDVVRDLGNEPPVDGTRNEQ